LNDIEEFNASAILANPSDQVEPFNNEEEVKEMNLMLETLEKEE